MSQENPSPRAEFMRLLADRDPYEIEKLMNRLHSVAARGAFSDVCEFMGKLEEAADPKDAIAAARAEVEKKPAREGAAPRLR